MKGISPNAPVRTVLYVGNKATQIGKKAALFISKDVRNKGIHFEAPTSILPVLPQKNGSIVVLSDGLVHILEENLKKEGTSYAKAFINTFLSANNVRHIN